MTRLVGYLRLGGLGLLVAGIVGCSQGGLDGNGQPLLVPEVVPAAEAKAMPGGGVAARYWVEIDPRAGQMNMFPVHEGNVIYRDEVLQTGVNYQYNQATCTNGTCTFPAGAVTIDTPQPSVTYVEDAQGVDDGNPADDTCYNNGATLPNDPTCGGKYVAGTPCTKHGSFCGDIELTSNIVFGNAVAAIPDVVLDLAPQAGTSLIGCLRNTSNGATGGLCEDDGPAKIASATSNFVPGFVAGAGTKTCAYCYGNKSVATANNRPALQHAVISGLSAEKLAVDTNKVALKLANGNGLDLTFVLYYAKPAVNAPASQLSYRDAGNAILSCVTPTSAVQTRIEVNGGGFGPPGDCINATFPSSCPLAGAAGTGFSIAGVGVPGITTSEWSDTRVRTGVVATTTYGCPLTVTGPHGTVTTDDSVTLCANNFRTYASTGYVPVTRSGGGARNNFALLLGGLTNPSVLTSGTNFIQVTPLPRCSSITPNTTTLTTRLPNGSGLWGAASAVATGGVYYAGGALNGAACSRKAFRVNYTSGSTATIVNLPDLPIALCGATMLNLFDRSNNNEYLVLTGGSTLPVPRSPITPAYSQADLAPLATYVFRIGAASWTTVNGVGLQRYNMGGAGHHDATKANNRGIFVGGAVTVGDSTPAVATTNIVTITNTNTISFTAGPVLPAVRSAAAVTEMDGKFYVAGGSLKSRTTDSGEKRLFSLASQPLGTTWTQLTAHQIRQGSILVPSLFDETAPLLDLHRLLLIGGSTNLTFPSLDEYNP